MRTILRVQSARLPPFPTFFRYEEQDSAASFEPHNVSPCFDATNDDHAAHCTRAHPHNTAQSKGAASCGRASGGVGQGWLSFGPRSRSRFCTRPRSRGCPVEGARPAVQVSSNRGGVASDCRNFFVKDNEALLSSPPPPLYIYRDRAGGYTRVLRCGFRSGDRAPMAIIEYVDRPGEVRKAKPGTFAKPAAAPASAAVFAAATAAAAPPAPAQLR